MIEMYEDIRLANSPPQVSLIGFAIDSSSIELEDLEGYVHGLNLRPGSRILVETSRPELEYCGLDSSRARPEGPMRKRTDEGFRLTHYHGHVWRSSPHSPHTNHNSSPIQKSGPDHQTLSKDMPSGMGMTFHSNKSIPTLEIDYSQQGIRVPTQSHSGHQYRNPLYSVVWASGMAGHGFAE